MQKFSVITASAYYIQSQLLTHIGFINGIDYCAFNYLYIYFHFYKIGCMKLRMNTKKHLMKII